MASSRHQLPPPEVQTRLRVQFGDDVLSFEDQHGHSVVAVTPEGVAFESDDRLVVVTDETSCLLRFAVAR